MFSSASELIVNYYNCNRSSDIFGHFNVLLNKIRFNIATNNRYQMIDSILVNTIIFTRPKLH